MIDKIDPITAAPNKLKEKNLKRAVYVLEQAEKQNVDLVANDDDYRKVCQALATLGEEARYLFIAFVALSVRSQDAESLNTDFTNGMAGTKYKTPAKFFEIASMHGLATKLPVSMKESKEKLTAADMIGDDEYAAAYNEYGFWESMGRYWSMDQRWNRYDVSNFTMRILWHVATGDERAYRLIALKNVYGHEASVNMNTDDFVSVGTFKKIVERRGNFLWKGGDSDLMKLKEKLQRDERPTKLVAQLGWHKRGQFYAFANGIFVVSENKLLPVDEYGIVALELKKEDGEKVVTNYFIPANSKLFEEQEDMYANDKKFVYTMPEKGAKPEDEFKKWVDQFVLVYGKHGQMMLIFYIAAIFSDIIFLALMRRFPLLFLYGKRGSGKGALAGSAMKLFGEGQDQLMLGGASTEKAMMRKFSQYSNALVWLDEYKNSHPVKLIESLKNLFDRIGYERAKKDNSFETETTPVKSACLLSGQEMPTMEPALFTRNILLSFKETTFTDEQRANFTKLEAIENKGISWITTYLLQYRPYFEANYRIVYEAELKALRKAVNNNEIDERLLANYASMIATAEVISAKLELPFSVISFREMCKQYLLAQFYVLKGSDDSSKFWDVVEMLFLENKIIEDKHFKLKNGFLYIRIQDVFQAYTKALIERKDPNVLDKQTLYSYLESDPQTFVKQEKKWFGGAQRWCHTFHYARLNIDLIRAEDEDAYKRRYAEMGLKYVPEEGEQQSLDIKKRP